MIKIGFTAHDLRQKDIMLPVKKIRVSLFSLGLAVFVLGACQKKLPVESLVSADPDLRTASIKTFSSWPDQERLHFVAPLIIYLHDNDSLVTQRAVEALKIAGVAAMPQIKPVLNDPDAYVRAAATEILAFYAKQDPSLEPVLENMAKDPHPLVNQEADFALKKLKTS